MCVYVCVFERERESVCVRVCERERLCVLIYLCVCVRERERESRREVGRRRMGGGGEAQNLFEHQGTRRKQRAESVRPARRG